MNGLKSLNIPQTHTRDWLFCVYALSAIFKTCNGEIQIGQCINIRIHTMSSMATVSRALYKLVFTVPNTHSRDRLVEWGVLTKNGQGVAILSYIACESWNLGTKLND